MEYLPQHPVCYLGLAVYARCHTCWQYFGPLANGYDCQRCGSEVIQRVPMVVEPRPLPLDRMA